LGRLPGADLRLRLKVFTAGHEITVTPATSLGKAWLGRACA
jgi:hypothetical protein